MKQVDQHALFALGILDMMEDGAFIFSPESLRFSYVNQGAVQQTGYSREELLGMTPLSLKLEFNEPQFRQMLEPLLRGEAKTVRFTTTHRRKNGHDILVEVIFHYLVPGNEAPSLVAIVRDVTDRKEAERALHEQKDFLNAVLENEPECVKVISKQGKLIQMNRAGLAMIEVDSLEEARLEGLVNFVLPEDRDAFIHLTRRVFSGGSGTLEFRVTGKKGTTRWLETHASPLYGTDGKVSALVGVTRDITSRKENESQIEFLAFHDPLTGLPNRILAKDHLEMAAAFASRTKTRVALLFLDLDNFKTINDSLGHAIGDELLKAAAMRLRDSLRNTDTISRQGGDEFIVLLPDPCDTETITNIAEKILRELSVPFDIQGHQLSTSASIGIAVYPDDGNDFDTLLKKADTAMYQSKKAGRSIYRFYTEQMNIDVVEHHYMLTGLAHALENNEFVLYYQPQINLASGDVIGAEALIRWLHPERGMVPPVHFISIAEDSGYIVPIGDWVLREACRQSVAWHQAGLPELTIAVNLSAVQFKRSNLETSVIQALADSGLRPELLELELTESILMQDTENILATVHRLKALGVKLSIDDFGTGYSSLSYLSRFAVDKLKIDQSFVRDMIDNPGNAAIVRAIIQMAKSLNLKTVAEGVEDENMLVPLRLHHCDEAQGYYFGRPMPADEFARFLTSSKT